MCHQTREIASSGAAVYTVGDGRIALVELYPDRRTGLEAVGLA